MPNISILRPEDLPLNNEEAIEIMSGSFVNLDTDQTVVTQVISQNTSNQSQPRRSQSSSDEYSPEETRLLVKKRIEMDKEFKKTPLRSQSDLWKKIKEFYNWPEEAKFTIEKMKKRWHNANKDWRDHCKRMQNDEHYRERSKELPAHIQLIDDFNSGVREARPNPIVTYDSVRDEHEVVHSSLRPAPPSQSNRTSTNDTHNVSQASLEAQEVIGEYGGRGDSDVLRERSRRLRRNDLYQYLHSNAQAIEKVANEMRKLRESMQDTNKAFIDILKVVFGDSRGNPTPEQSSFDHDGYHRPFTPESFSAENRSRSRSRSPLRRANID